MLARTHELKNYYDYHNFSTFSTTPSLIYPTSAVIRFTFEVSKSILIPCSIEGSMTDV